MKMLTVILFFFVSSGVCYGEICRCMSYLISENGLSNENKISTIEYTIEGTICDGNGLMECKYYCVKMYEQLTNNGRICLKMPGDDKRVADWMCESLKKDVCNGRVGVFAQNCGSDPLDTGFRFIDTLCCKSGFSLHC